MVSTPPPALSPDAQAAADRALLREAMLNEQLDASIEQRATAPAGLTPQHTPGRPTRLACGREPSPP